MTKNVISIILNPKNNSAIEPVYNFYNWSDIAPFWDEKSYLNS